MPKFIIEYAVTYKPHDGPVTVDNVHAFSEREARQLAREILQAEKIIKVENTGVIGTAP